MPGTRIPTLDEVLDLGKTSSKIRFNVEIKSSEKMQDMVLAPDEISRRVVEALRKHKLENRAMVQSFDFRVVKATRKVAPSITAAALYGPGERDFVDIAKGDGRQARDAELSPGDFGEGERRPSCGRADHPLDG